MELDVTWLPFEIHPEVPAEGRSRPDRSGDAQTRRLGLRARAAELGLPMEVGNMIFNTHRALLLAEYARDMGKGEEVHRRLFHVYWVERRNLADAEVLREIAAQAGLDPDAAMAALENPEYEERISRSIAVAQAYGVNGVPTFIVEDKYMIVGAQPYEYLLEAFRKIREMMA